MPMRFPEPDRLPGRWARAPLPYNNQTANTLNATYLVTSGTGRFAGVTGTGSVDGWLFIEHWTSRRSHSPSWDTEGSCSLISKSRSVVLLFQAIGAWRPPAAASTQKAKAAMPLRRQLGRIGTNKFVW